jgi:PEP-CTERM motif
MKNLIPAFAAAFIATIGASCAAQAALIDFGAAALGGTITYAGGTHLNMASSFDLDGSKLTISSIGPGDDSGLSIGGTVTVSPTNLIFGTGSGTINMSLGVNEFTKTWTAGADVFTETLDTVVSINRMTTNAITVVFSGTVSDTANLFTNTPASLIFSANQAKNAISAELTNTASAVPEPSTWVMMGLGFIGLGYAAVRRGKTKVAMLSAA